MEQLGPPWQYDPKLFYGFVAIAGFLAAVLIILIIAFFINKFFKYRHETKIARIQSGNLDPIQTQAGAFLVLRRGIVLMFFGLTVGMCVVVDHPAPLAFLPFSFGLAYLVIYLIHARGLLKLFPENGKQQREPK